MPKGRRDATPLPSPSNPPRPNLPAVSELAASFAVAGGARFAARRRFSAARPSRHRAPKLSRPPIEPLRRRTGTFTELRSRRRLSPSPSRWKPPRRGRVAQSGSPSSPLRIPPLAVEVQPPELHSGDSPVKHRRPELAPPTREGRFKEESRVPAFKTKFSKILSSQLTKKVKSSRKSRARTLISRRKKALIEDHVLGWCFPRTTPVDGWVSRCQLKIY
ncbi:uncharacterized protein LOC133902325 [Phragmites australis]|uniref:uncharacterized protein LOC133902325 n=1 Tax=Phragmites australis TaxID=29695 RepID=UPI002D7834AC|nr:uncharacterized protein LOC133902325 [Phragmites australis]